MKTIKPASQATFFRERCFFSVNAAVIISNILNDEVKIANRNNSKNKLKKTSPNGICAKAAGKTTNNKPGRSAGSNRKEKTTGKMASPARNETKRFMYDKDRADGGKLTSLCK